MMVKPVFPAVDGNTTSTYEPAPAKLSGTIVQNPTFGGCAGERSRYD